MSKVQSHEFQAEITELLDLMVHSLYTNKDIFLRELISNASDALDRLRFESLTDESLMPEGELEIRIDADPELRTLFVSDNGIGMTAAELIENLGTIARSGTREFVAAAQQAKGQVAPELIGQFGVGFYSCFMVADRVEVLTRRAGTTTAHRWRSIGDGTFTIEEAEREASGTTIVLHLGAVDEENGVHDYTNEWVLRGIIKKYSDFVSYPIRMKGEKDEYATVNSMKAVWARPKDDVTDEEYVEFYKHIAHDWHEPLTRIAVKMEGAVEARALLFVPSKAPIDLYHHEMSYRGIQLYVKQVFILDECRDLMPLHLRFIKGVVDSEDLSLNVSREMLQQDRQITAIRKFLVRKIFEELKRLKQEDEEKYGTFWAEFGPVLKEGFLTSPDQHEALFDLMLCATSNPDLELTSLADYVERMKEDQEEIYFITGATSSALRASPHIEKLVAAGYEVLFFTDRVDEVWLQHPTEYHGKSWQSVGRGEVELGSAEEKEKARLDLDARAKEYTDLLSYLQRQLDDQIKEVRLSSRLAASAACLVGDENDMSPQIATMLREMGQDVPPVKMILELNPDHELVRGLQSLYEKNRDDAELANLAHLLYGQAVLAEGGQVPDPPAFAKLLASLMTKAV